MAEKAKPKILLELRVQDDGIMLLEATKQVVTGGAIGEPKRITVVADSGNTGEDFFTDRAAIIHKKAPPLANAYSPGRAWEPDGEGDSTDPFYVERLSERCDHLHQSIQYFRLDTASLELARQAIY